VHKLKKEDSVKMLHVKKSRFLLKFLFCVFWKKISALCTSMYHQKKKSVY